VQGAICLVFITVEDLAGTVFSEILLKEKVRPLEETLDAGVTGKSL